MGYRARRAQQPIWRQRLGSLSRPLAPGIASAALICGVVIAAAPAAGGADVAVPGGDAGREVAVGADRPLLELGGTTPNGGAAGRDDRTNRSGGRADPDTGRKDLDKKDLDKKAPEKKAPEKKAPEKKDLGDHAPKSKGSGTAGLDVTVVSPPKPDNDGGSTRNGNGTDDDNDGSAGGNSGSSGSTQPCPSGSSVEQGLVPNAIKVHRDVCHRWPQLTNYGGVRPDSMPEHPSGRALDIMISNNATGWEVARYLRANAGRLGISQVIFDQKIWTVQRSGEGWRWMSDRGGATANHRDHVHVTVYG